MAGRDLPRWLNLGNQDAQNIWITSVDLLSPRKNINTFWMPMEERTQSELFAPAVFRVPRGIATQVGADVLSHHHMYGRKRTS